MADDSEPDDSEPDDSSTGHDEEGPDQPTGSDPGLSDDPSTPEELSGAENTMDGDDPDSSDDGPEAVDDDTGRGPDGTGERNEDTPDPIVDPLGESAPRPHEWLEEEGGTDESTDPNSQEEAPETNPQDQEPSGGLTRVDDEFGPSRDPDGQRPEDPPSNRTRSGQPDTNPPPAEHEPIPDESPGAIDGPENIVGPLPPEEAKRRNRKAAEYGPQPLQEPEADLEELGPDADPMEQYERQGELIEENTGQELLEPETEAAVDESETGGILDRDGEGPPDDQEMPLTEHVEEMVRRLGIVVIAAAVMTILAWPFSQGATLHIWTAVLPTADAPDPHLYGPLEKVLTQIKVAGLAGILIALPLIVYQTYRFMRPGLYPHERRYYLAAVPTSLVLAAAGMAFSYFLVLPTLFVYFMYYTEGSVDLVAFGLAKTFNLIVTLTGVLAVVFQIPLFIMLAIMMGVTSRQWLANKRIYFWAAFAGGSFLIAPDPTGMAPFLVAGTAIGLFEGTLFLLKWVKRGRRRYRSGREEGA
ncbi:MAG: sec-independent protein translocase protein TatC [Natrialbaceae archaeon]|jgi:sec-independent protein translocase protein TatC